MYSCLGLLWSLQILSQLVDLEKRFRVFFPFVDVYYSLNSLLFKSCISKICILFSVEHKQSLKYLLVGKWVEFFILFWVGFFSIFWILLVFLLTQELVYDVDLYVFDGIFFIRAAVFLGPRSVTLTQDKLLVMASRKVFSYTICNSSSGIVLYIVKVIHYNIT